MINDRYKHLANLCQKQSYLQITEQRLPRMGPTNFLKLEFRTIVQDLLQTLCGQRLWELLGLCGDANTYKGCMEYRNEIYLLGCSVSIQFL